MQLQLYSEKPEDLAQSQERTRSQTSALVEQLGKQVRSEDQAFPQFLSDFNKGRFWNALQYVDGAEIKTLEKRAHQRKRAETHLNDAERKELGTLILNQALLKPYGTKGWPGLSQGHCILYQQVLKVPDSLYHQAIRPFEKRLVNGAFWEAFPELHLTNYDSEYALIKEILLEKQDFLDLSFASQGAPIYKKNRGLTLGDEHLGGVDLQGYEDDVLDALASWLRKLAEVQLSLPEFKPEVLTDMSLSYIGALFSTCPPEYEDLHYGSSSEEILERFNQSWLQSLLERSPILRKRLAHECAALPDWYGNIVKDLLKEISYAHEVVQNI